MGIDWETLLNAEGEDLAGAYEDMVDDAREKMDEMLEAYRERQRCQETLTHRCVPRPKKQNM